jgi:hypothetical protein
VQNSDPHGPFGIMDREDKVLIDAQFNRIDGFFASEVRL